jgi:hypothetical protein
VDRGLPLCVGDVIGSNCGGLGSLELHLIHRYLCILATIGVEVVN